MAEKLKLEAAAAYVDDDFATSIDLYTKVARCISFPLPPSLQKLQRDGLIGSLDALVFYMTIMTCAVSIMTALSCVQMKATIQICLTLD